jgi:hypothetical protein
MGRFHPIYTWRFICWACTSFKGWINSGVIDWSTAHIDDPAIDFAGHVTLFGEESLKTLIIEYEKLGVKFGINYMNRL